MSSAPNVLRVNSAAEQASYREAVAEILRRVQSEHSLTLLEIADRIDVSLGTVSNAANKKNDLNPIYLNRLGQVFGPHTLDPYAALSHARMVPLDADPALDALPPMTAAIHRIAVARSPQSPGGEAITHGELLDMEPVIDDAIRALTALKVRAGKLRAA